MENNPQTIVIFAGYTNEMSAFIEQANSGLRSRLTNIIEFPDYENEEMLEIFEYLLKKDGYKIKAVKKTRKRVNEFINEIRAFGNQNIGNGRLMRTLFHAVIGFKTESGGKIIMIFSLFISIRHAENSCYQKSLLDDQMKVIKR